MVYAVKLFLLVYDRKAGTLISRREFSAEQRADALEKRFAEERTRVDQADVEVVLLGAESWEALEKTHSRYFKTMQEMLRPTTG